MGIDKILTDLKKQKKVIENIIIYKRSISERENLTMLNCSILSIENELSI